MFAPMLFVMCLGLALVAAGQTDPIALGEGLETLGPSGVMLFVPIYVASNLMVFPASACCILAGWLYGPMWGFLLVWPCAVFSAAACFLIGRTALRTSVSTFSESYPILKALDQALMEDGPRVLFLLRLSPIMPFAPLSYAMGGSPLRLRGFLIASALGGAPGMFFYVYLGATIEQMDELFNQTAGSHDLWATTPLSWIGLVATFGGVWLIGRRAKAILARHMDEEETFQTDTTSTP